MNETNKVITLNISRNASGEDGVKYLSTASMNEYNKVIYQHNIFTAAKEAFA